MPLAPPTRVNYFDRQFIRVAEMHDEQAYHVDLRRRHNLSHHCWGIVLGLDIVKQQDGRPAVQRGVAVDGYGRELFLLQPEVVGRETFDRYGTSRLDLWLEYQLEFDDDRLAPIECGGADPRRHYRAVERVEVVYTRGGAKPDPHRPPGVPADALVEPLLSPSDDPRNRWPVYLGRLTMELPASGPPLFSIDTADRVYVGLNAEVIDHPGNATRLELGRRPPDVDVRTIGNDQIQYAANPERDFAIFVPGTDVPLQPTIAVYGQGTEIRGAATIHGNLVLDGASLQFPDASDAQAPGTDDQPAIYRAASPGGDELRIDMGSLNLADRRLVLGATKDGKFLPALDIYFPQSMASGSASPVVTVYGDLRIAGTIQANDMRTRTVTEDVAALLTGMVQAGIASGGS
jgi:hypothetical protein